METGESDDAIPADPEKANDGPSVEAKNSDSPGHSCEQQPSSIGKENELSVNERNETDTRNESGTEENTTETIVRSELNEEPVVDQEAILDEIERVARGWTTADEAESHPPEEEPQPTTEDKPNLDCSKELENEASAEEDAAEKSVEVNDTVESRKQDKAQNDSSEEKQSENCTTEAQKELPECGEDPEDDDVIVVETRINSANATNGGQGSGTVPVALSQAPATAGACTSDHENNLLAAPATSVPINPSQQLSSVTRSFAVAITTQQQTSSGTSRPTFATLPTSIASVLKALANASSQSNIPGTSILLSRVPPATAIPSLAKGQNSSCLKTAAGPVRIVSAGVQSQANYGRQLLPKPGVVSPAVQNPVPNQNVGQLPRPQVTRQDPTLANGNATNGYECRQDVPAYLKTVLNPASVRPYRFAMLPKEHGFLTPEGGYRCETCGDAFALKSCLEFHLQRRSVIIECSCVMCRQPLVFFNKCVYYAHIRQHSGNQSEVADLTMRNVNVKPITWDLMELSYEDIAFKRMLNVNEFLAYETGRSVSSVESGDLQSVAERTAGLENQATTATTALAQMLYSAANASSAPPTAKICSECNKETANATLLRQHFMYNLPSSQKQLICTTCQAVYFSQCSFKAHMRIHSKSPPYTCPECGTVESTAHLLNSHVLTHQKNPTVMDAWRCQKCLTFYSSWDALIAHIGASHCDSYYRCQHCPMAFTAVQAFEHHLRNQHEHVGPIQAADARLLMKCCQCDMVYVSREPLVEHLKPHFIRLMPFVVYRCALCGRLMENKSGLIGHFKNVHRFSVQSGEVFPVKIQVVRSSSMPPKRVVLETHDSVVVSSASATATSEASLSCSHCSNASFPNIASLKLHLKRRHPEQPSGSGSKKTRNTSKESQPPTRPVGMDKACNFCTRKFATNPGLIDDGVRHLKAGISVCLLCQNTDHGNAVSLSKHLMRHIEFQRSGATRDQSQPVAFTCIGHCEQTYPSAEAGLAHLRALHLLPYLRCSACDAMFMNEHELRTHAFRHERDASSSSPEEPKELSQCGSDVQSKIVDAAPIEGSVDDSTGSPGCVRCSKCGELFRDIERMRSHATAHREAKYYLCLECGLSFAATTSLGRHLIMAHKISSVDKYLQDYPDSNPGKPSELECSVCHKEFPSKPLLDAHVRTHGLLFLKTKARPTP